MKRKSLPRPADRVLPNAKLTLQNRFNVLQDTTPEPAQLPNNTQARPSPPVSRPARTNQVSVKMLPPIIIPTSPTELRDFTEAVMKCCKSPPKIRLFSDGSSKIYTSNDADNQTVMAFLGEAQIPFFTHTKPGTHPKKIVVKAAPYFTADEILSFLKNSTPHVQKVHKLRASPGKTSGSFLVEFDKTQNLGDLRQIESLGGVLCKWQPYAKLGATQCHNCLQFGHGSTLCFLESRCLRCAGNHHTQKCNTQIDSPASLKCANCHQNHAANFRGCPKYPQRPVQSAPAPQRQSNPRSLPNSTAVTGAISYSAMARNAPNQPYATQFPALPTQASQQSHPSNTLNPSSAPQTNQPTNDFFEIMEGVNTLNSLVDMGKVLSDLKKIIQLIQTNPQVNPLFHFLTVLNG